ncbi:hypothetical protein [Dactylosporangium sp. CA-233914]|uniref:hypothetical protein n=1 Tax=Dactylosporangium sp. CA-233914 TaxID=3239934 RepID=UPI003D91FC52
MPSVPCLRARMLGFAVASALALVSGAALTTVLALAFAAAAIPVAAGISDGVPRVLALCGLRSPEPSKEPT